MQTFDGKSEKLEQFEVLFQTSLKFHNQQPEEDKINFFYCPLRCYALQTVKKLSSSNRKNLREVSDGFLSEIRETQ